MEFPLIAGTYLGDFSLPDYRFFSSLAEERGYKLKEVGDGKEGTVRVVVVGNKKHMDHVTAQLCVRDMPEIWSKLNA